MALGGGTFVSQNKELPGVYINFVSASSASAVLSERGIATMPLELDWGIPGEVFEVTGEMFQKNCREIFGYDSSHEKMRGLQDLFLNARTLYAYRVNGKGQKAENSMAVAEYPGIRGNDLMIAVQVNADDENMFDVRTMLGVETVDEQTVGKAEDLMPNSYVRWKSDAVLEAAAGNPLTGGTNGTATGNDYQDYLNKIESYAYNTMGAAVTDRTTKALFTSFVKRLRDEMGVKFQLVLYDYAEADHMGVISVKNKICDQGWGEAGLVYWATGISAGCAVNKSSQNRKYDGSFQVDTAYTQNQLKEAIRGGEFILHRAGQEIRVLADINTLVTVSDTQGEIFQENQTVRVIDQIGNDIAVLFNTKYLGAVPNNSAGRVSLWSDIVAYHRQLEQIDAIEDFSDADVTAKPGNSKKAVVITTAITVVNTMDKLYMSVTVS